MLGANIEQEVKIAFPSAEELVAVNSLLQGEGRFLQAAQQVNRYFGRPNGRKKPIRLRKQEVVVAQGLKAPEYYLTVKKSMEGACLEGVSRNYEWEKCLSPRCFSEIWKEAECGLSWQLLLLLELPPDVQYEIESAYTNLHESPFCWTEQRQIGAWGELPNRRFDFEHQTGHVSLDVSQFPRGAQYELEIEVPIDRSVEEARDYWIRVLNSLEISWSFQTQGKARRLREQLFVESSIAA